MADNRDRRLEDLRAVEAEDVRSAGILRVSELPQFEAAVEQNFSGEEQQALLDAAEGIEDEGRVPESAVDPGIRAREPTAGDTESIRARLAGEAGTPSDEFEFKDESEGSSSNDIEFTNTDDAFIERPAQDQDTPVTQEQVFLTGQRRERAQEYNQTERSDRARGVDEEYNAPVTTDFEKWKENPNRFDFPGVDTIPDDRRQKRAADFAAEAQSSGVVENFEIGTGVFGDSSPGTRGSASGDTVLVDTSRAADAGQTLAHEVGHKVEERVREREGELFTSESAQQDAETLSTQLRGDPDDAYRSSDSELFADAVAASVLAPRRTERDAPEFVEDLNENVTEDERDILPDRLF